VNPDFIFETEFHFKRDRVLRNIFR